MASEPHTALLSTVKGPLGQQAAAQIGALYAKVAHDVDRYNEGKTPIHPAFTAPGGSRGEAIAIGAQAQIGQEQAGCASMPPLDVQQRRNSTGMVSSSAFMARSATAQQSNRLVSAPSSPSPSLGRGLPQQPASIQQLPPSFAPTISQLQGSPAQMSAPPLRQFCPTPPFMKTRSVSYSQLFARKILESKFGPLPHLPVAGAHKFPFAALWHLDLSCQSRTQGSLARLAPDSISSLTSRSLCCFGVFDFSAPPGSDAKSGRWSATCTFDVGTSLHTFAARDAYDQQSDALECLAQQILEQDIIWSLTYSCLLQELKSARRAPANPNASTAPVMRLLVKSKSDLAQLECADHDLNERMRSDIQQRLECNSVLHLDWILSQRQQCLMVYSCEQVEMPTSRGPRILWSVAAQLHPSMLGEIDAGAAGKIVTSIKDTKVSKAWRQARVHLEREHAKEAVHSQLIDVPLYVLSALLRWTASWNVLT